MNKARPKHTHTHTHTKLIRQAITSQHQHIKGTKHNQPIN